MSESAAATTGSNERMTGWRWRIFFANYLGIVFEAYDLTIYALLAVPISEYFNVPVWYSFVVLALTYVLRSVGGFFFGAIGDRLGRRNALIITVLGYSLATGLTGASWSLVSLIVFRALTGLFLGGEYIGLSYTMEIVPHRHRSVFSGLVMGSYSVGFLLASASFSIVTAIMGSNFTAGGGWRWPFFVGIAPALIALYLRLGVQESPAWKALAQAKRLHERIPVFEVFKPPYLRRTIHAGLMMAALYWAYNAMLLGFPTTLHYLGRSNAQIGELSIIVNVGSLVAAFVGGLISHRLGRRRALVTIALLGIPVVFLFAPFWMLPALPSYLYLAAFGFIGALFAEGGFGVMPAYLAERYPTKVRATGATGTFNVGWIVAGWSLTLMAAIFGGSPELWMKGVVINAVVGFVVVAALALVGRETRGVDLERYADEQTERPQPVGEQPAPEGGSPQPGAT